MSNEKLANTAIYRKPQCPPPPASLKFGRVAQNFVKWEHPVRTRLASPTRVGNTQVA